ncbi:MAG TPA: hypothetical protein VMD30_09820, partial [Tepidisphaeraceae bacterium]|nr:hypothetical protein [Tepidisphaeraceae bacterium]
MLTRVFAIAAEFPLSTLPAGGAHWPREQDLVAWCQTIGPATSALLLAAGLIFLLWGFPVFKYLMMLNAGIIGAYLGASVGHKMDTVIAGALIGGFICAAITWPLARWAVALTGAALGLLIGSSIWRLTGQDINFDWAGGLIGMVFCGMLSFILFRGSVILFTSIQGAVLILCGILGFAYKYPSIAPEVSHALAQRPFILQAAVVLPAV